MRAPILGAFFNAVFLIALCVSIVLEAITRLIDPPEISNPKLILIVGCLGLASNLAGFFVLGGHGHSHGPEEHGHSHGEHGHVHNHKEHSENEIRAAEEGRVLDGATGSNANEDESGAVADVLPDAILAKAAQAPQTSKRHVNFTSSDETGNESRLSHASGGKNSSKSSRTHRRRTSSIRSSNRLTNLDDMSIHPASFRQDIIQASRSHLDGIESEEGSGSDGEVIEDDTGNGPTETSPLLSSGKTNGKSAKPNGNGDAHNATRRARHDSWHAEHNHNKPRKAATSHGHSHDDMGMRAMVLHVIGDALGNAGVIATALFIWLTPWSGRFYADPCVSLFITAIILHTTIPLTKASAKILLQATPEHLDPNLIKEDIQNIPGVVSCHHLHIWQLSDNQNIASMHIQVAFPLDEAESSRRYMELAKAARSCLHEWGIHSATIQPEFCLDREHQHVPDSGMNLDGIPARLQVDNDSCLLECVDDCEEQGCCQPTANGGKTSAKSTPTHSDHGDHEHNHDHDHDHNHSDHGGQSEHNH